MIPTYARELLDEALEFGRQGFSAVVNFFMQSAGPNAGLNVRSSKSTMRMASMKSAWKLVAAALLMTVFAIWNHCRAGKHA